jgi:thimet oligopeptidase
MVWFVKMMALACLTCAFTVRAEPLYEFPKYEKTAQIEAACAQLLKQARADEARLQATPSGTLLTELDALTQRYENVVGPLTVLGAVHPQKSIRNAAERCELTYQAFSNAFFQNQKIYQQLQKIKPFDDIDLRYQRDLLDAFEDAGVALSRANRIKAKQLATHITGLTQQFERRIREDKTRIAFTEKELNGVPSKIWQKNARDAQGHYLLGLDAPTVQALLESATTSQTRERFWRAYLNQGGQANLKLLAQLSQARRIFAKLFGFDSYADFALRRRMAGTEQDVQNFLSNVHAAVAEREANDLKILALDQPQLKRWDVAFYTEQGRQKKFQVDQNQFRKHFPPEASLAWVFQVAQKMFGIRFESSPQTLWHPEAKAYSVIDEKNQQPLGVLMVDMYPRENKYNHAAVWSFRNSATHSHRLPAAALVVNLNREGLSLREMETLLHEFGHALHSLLSNTRYAGQGGTNTALDFVEAPSQMLEEWVYDPEVLALMKTVCSTCEAVPSELLARAEHSREFGKGIQIARQHLFAIYDLALYGKAPSDPLTLWKKMEGATPLGHEKGSLFPASFGHIAGGYAAGYYGYLWSLVLAEDLRTAFLSQKINPEVASRYRQDILSQGGQVLPKIMMKNFLSREFNSDAFFKSLQKK